MRSLRKIVLLALLGATPFHGAIGVVVVVPNRTTFSDGNADNRFPFLIKNVAPSMRYQQVYHASQFADAGPAGGYITRIFFRVDCTNSAGLGGATNARINLSTTSKAPDGLSLSFVDNVGSDDRPVFGPGQVPITPGSGGGGGCPRPFNAGLLLANPFYYHPARGNLLLDVRNFSEGYYQTAPPFPSLAMDAESFPGDSVSRIYANDVFATNATVVSTLGLVTAFEFQPVPALSIQTETQANAVLIRWPAELNSFVLEWTPALDGSANWQGVTNTVVTGLVFKTVTIPYADLKAVQYFRLTDPPGTTAPNRALHVIPEGVPQLPIPAPYVAP